MHLTSWQLKIIAIIVASFVILPIASADHPMPPMRDRIAPKIFHEPVTETVRVGASRLFKAIVTDNIGVKSVSFFYRTLGDHKYTQIIMLRSANTDEFVTRLGYEKMIKPGIEYYIQAVDFSGNSLLFGFAHTPLHISVGDNKNGISDKLPDGLSKSKYSYQDNKWLWIGIGVLAAGAIIANDRDDSGSDPSAKPETGNIEIVAPDP